MNSERLLSRYHSTVALNAGERAYYRVGGTQSYQLLLTVDFGKQKRVMMLLNLLQIACVNYR